MGTAADVIDQRYLVRELLGCGGMAEVYRATDTRTRRDVAIKLLRDAERGHAQRFRNELDVHARLDHPGLVRLRGSGTHEGVPYLVLDLVVGPTLAERLDHGPLDLERTLAVGERVADALAHVHGMGVVHRDVKPSNILFDARGVAHLADFGIARAAGTPSLTRTGQLVGSAPYLAPEHVEGKETGPPADVYALGLVLVECLTGRRCYTGGQVEAALSRLHRAPELPDDLPRWLRDVLTAMTARHPARRPTAVAVAESLLRRTAEPVVAVTAPLDAPAPRAAAPGGGPPPDIPTAASVHDPVITAPLDVPARRAAAPGGAPPPDIPTAASVHDPVITAPLDPRESAVGGDALGDAATVGRVRTQAVGATTHHMPRGGPARTRRPHRTHRWRLTTAAAAAAVAVGSLLAWTADDPDSPGSRSSVGSARRPVAAVAGAPSDATGPDAGPAATAPAEEPPSAEASAASPPGAGGSEPAGPASGQGTPGPSANASPNAGGGGNGQVNAGGRGKG